ncbi:MAG: CDP-alcohol phosphatidyltransferase family protein [Propionibacteriaceae bacterium]|nr:CDP-alcohol phosphatidyltransferase family protein [Propionibacteriaceae bacterium]
MTLIPSRTQRRAEGREPRRPISQLPNLVTLLALACGLTAARLAFSGSAHITAILLLMLAAAILDSIDGRLARLLKAQSGMGAQLDSFSDVIAFGVAPAFITYWLVAAHDDGRSLINFAWLAAMIYVGAIVLRLARFNLLHDDPDPLPFQAEFFVGVPAPAAAWLALTPVVCQQAFGAGWWSHPLTCSIWLILVAVLAFSKLPTLTFKTTRIPQRYLPLVLLVCFVAIAAFFTFPYETALVVIGLYLLHIPVAIYQHRFLTSHPEIWQASPDERRQLRRQGRRERHQGRRERHQARKPRRILGRRPQRRPAKRRRSEARRHAAEQDPS